MSSRYLSKNNRKAKKGISPVIATVILVAVAVVIAAALAGFSSTLFGSYSQGSQISIRTMEVYATGSANPGAWAAGTGDAVITMVNKGGAAETVVGVEISGFGEADGQLVPADIRLDDDVGDPVIPANSEATLHILGLDDTAAGDPELDAGQQVTVTVTTEGGQQYTISTVVKA